MPGMFRGEEGVPGRAPCLLTLPEAVGGELGLGSAVEAFEGAPSL